MLRALTKARKEGYKIIYIDETMFTRRSIPTKEYRKASQNMTVDQALINEPTLALLSGISKERGQEAYMICLLYTSPSPRDATLSRMPSSA